jgi:hypothetical protein
MTAALAFGLGMFVMSDLIHRMHPTTTAAAVGGNEHAANWDAASAAGYRWADENSPDQPRACPGHRKAFIAGCTAWIKDQYGDALRKPATAPPDRGV